ncbi:MAG: transaldolase, partial [Actinomycetota bacterium]|nr:transaldolase [Actinomycetota bacterium]
MSNTDALQALAEAGVSIWLDDLSRQRIISGNLADLIANRHVVGVTSNPTIFAHALEHAEDYDEQVRALAARGATVEETVREITVADVQLACDVFSGTWETTGGLDGRVSLEVDPRLAHDTDATLAQAAELWKTVDRPNLMIKVPATPEGLPAITGALADGISVNVTLVFSVQRYREVMAAFFAGLEQAGANGHDLASIASVASFFVSRVDTEVDKRL